MKMSGWLGAMPMSKMAMMTDGSPEVMSQASGASISKSSSPPGHWSQGMPENEAQGSGHSGQQGPVHGTEQHVVAQPWKIFWPLLCRYHCRGNRGSLGIAANCEVRIMLDSANFTSGCGASVLAVLRTSNPFREL